MKLLKELPKPEYAPEPVFESDEEIGPQGYKSIRERLEAFLNANEHLKMFASEMCEYFEWLLPLFAVLRNAWPIYPG